MQLQFKKLVHAVLSIHNSIHLLFLEIEVTKAARVPTWGYTCGLHVQKL